MANKYLTVNGKVVLVDGKMVEVPSETESSNTADEQSELLETTQLLSDELPDQVVGYVDGSPRGVYENLSALQTAYPNGTVGVYVCTDNGHWYYWNGTAWSDGGVYQAVGLADMIDKDLIAKSITINEATIKDTISGTAPVSLNTSYTDSKGTTYETKVNTNKTIKLESIKGGTQNNNIELGGSGLIADTKIKLKQDILPYSACGAKLGSKDLPFHSGAIDEIYTNKIGNKDGGTLLHLGKETDDSYSANFYLTLGSYVNDGTCKIDIQPDVSDTAYSYNTGMIRLGHNDGSCVDVRPSSYRDYSAPAVAIKTNTKIGDNYNAQTKFTYGNEDTAFYSKASFYNKNKKSWYWAYPIQIDYPKENAARARLRWLTNGTLQLDNMGSGLDDPTRGLFQIRCPALPTDTSCPTRNPAVFFVTKDYLIVAIDPSSEEIIVGIKYDGTIVTSGKYE